MLSEIGYYFSEEELFCTAQILVKRLTRPGRLLATHWLGTSRDHRLSGDRVHEILNALDGLQQDLSARYAGFRLDRWVRLVNSPSWHVSILIPARNGEELLPRCLRSVISACSLLPRMVTTDLVVAVDRSTDRTFELAIKLVEGRGAVVLIESGAVGKARRAAAHLAIQRSRAPVHRCWLSNTDADCVVPRRWLAD